MKKLIIFILALYLVIPAFSQKLSPFIIGDPAPEIKYSKWLKGTPVTSFDKNKVYVIECWATWCGPCIAAMPHLSELAKKYEGKAIFIGMNVWEKIPEDQSYESVLPRVTQFASSLGDKMSYNIAVDDANRYMAKNWLARAKAPGIPTTFVIKGGILMWIGHPSALDKILLSIEDGTFQIAQHRESHLQSINISVMQETEDFNLKQPINEAIKMKEYSKALDLWDSLMIKKPQQKYIGNINKFSIILDYIGEKNAIQYSEDWKKKDGKRVSMYLAQEIIKKQTYSKETYLYAAQEFISAAGGGSNINPMFFDMIGTSYAYAKDYVNAAMWQQKAVESAQVAIKDSKFVGVIMDYTVTEYADKLKLYKEKVSKN